MGVRADNRQDSMSERRSSMNKRRISKAVTAAAVIGVAPSVILLANPGVAAAAGTCEHGTWHVGPTGYNTGSGTVSDGGCGTGLGFTNDVFAYNAVVSTSFSGQTKTTFGTWLAGLSGAKFVRDNGASHRQQVISNLSPGVHVRLHGTKGVATSVSMQY